MRWLTLVLVALVLALQLQLWFGKGGWLKVWEHERQLATMRTANHKLESRNGALDADVRDLKQGYEAIEERARYDIGLIRDGEVFVQLPPFENNFDVVYNGDAPPKPADQRGVLGETGRQYTRNAKP